MRIRARIDKLERLARFARPSRCPECGMMEGESEAEASPLGSVVILPDSDKEDGSVWIFCKLCLRSFHGRLTRQDGKITAHDLVPAELPV